MTWDEVIARMRQVAWEDQPFDWEFYGSWLAIILIVSALGWLLWEIFNIDRRRK